jgi:hypothetical protein
MHDVNAYLFLHRLSACQEMTGNPSQQATPICSYVAQNAVWYEVWSDFILRDTSCV